LIAIIGAGAGYYYLSTSNQEKNSSENINKNSDNNDNSGLVVNDNSNSDEPITLLNYTNDSIGFTMDYPSNWTYWEEYSSEYYQYVYFYPETDSYTEGSTHQQEVVVATEWHRTSPCSSYDTEGTSCNEISKIDVQANGTNKKTALYKTTKADGSLDFYAFKLQVDLPDDDYRVVLGYYHNDQEKAEILNIIKTLKLE